MNCVCVSKVHLSSDESASLATSSVRVCVGRERAWLRVEFLSAYATYHRLHLELNTDGRVARGST